MLVTTSELYPPAYGKYAIGHFNATNMEQILGIFAGAVQAEAPFILAFTRAAWEYAGLEMLNKIVAGAQEKWPQAVFALHHDHGTENSCLQAIESGLYTSVMVDASHHPFDKNIDITRRVVDRAHQQGLSVEAELGVLAGVEDRKQVEAHDAFLTDPDQAAEFVERTGCDSLAVAVGTRHGAYKFSAQEGIRFERLANIQAALPGFPLVLHGASAVYPDEVKRVNAAGGALKNHAKGVDELSLGRAIHLGVTKVNIGTDGRLLWARVHREFFRDRPDRFDFSEPGKLYIQEFADMVAKKCRVLGSAHKSHRLKMREEQ